METKDWWKFAVGVMSALFALSGTWLISRRYFKEFWRSLFYSLVAPFFLLLQQKEKLENFLEQLSEDNRARPESAKDMNLGLILLFWSFLLQLALPFFDLKVR